MRKMLEHSFKAVVQDAKGISGGCCCCVLRTQLLTACSQLAHSSLAPRAPPPPPGPGRSGGAACLRQALPKVHGPSVSAARQQRQQCLAAATYKR